MSFVLPGTGTGALSKRNIHVSISRISHAISDEICSMHTLPLEPLNMPQTVSRPLPARSPLDIFEPMVELGDVLDPPPGLAASERA